MSLAVDGGEVVGVAAMSFFRTALDGVETRLAIPVNVATDPRYRGQGVFSTLERENEAAAAATGSPLTVTFPNGASYPIFMSRLGWVDLPRLRLWARPLRAGAVVRYALGRPGERGGLRAPEPTRAHDPRPRDAARRALRRGDRRARASRGGRLREPLRPRRRVLQLALPRLAARLPLLRRVPRTARCAASPSSGTRSSTASRPAFSPISSRRRTARRRVRALFSRAVDEVKGGADALVLLPPPSRGAPARARSRRASRRRTRSCASSASRSTKAHRSTSARTRGTSPSATSTSSDARQARLHHAAGRPAAPGARRDRAEDRARSRSSSTRSSCSPTALSRASCRRTAACATFRARRKAGRGVALRGGARARASRSSRRRGRRAHVPDLRRARRAARPAAPRPARPLVHALAREPAAAGGRAGLDAR